MPPARPRRIVPGRSLTARSLRRAMEANEAAYRRALAQSGPGTCWDYLVLTAANAKQAEGYRHELRLRERSFFPPALRTLVVPDPPGTKVGSGGATLGVMRTLSSRFRLKPPDFDRLHILLIHSGGLSQRLPMYAALGKVFMPLPLLRPDGQLATLFDHLYVTLAGLPPRLGPGLLVAAGDVMLVFDHRDVKTPRPGVTAISMRASADLGRGHGVFVTDTGGRIERTLQKASVEQMKAAGATEAGGVLIDTGLLFFDPARTRTLLRLARSTAARNQVDLYSDITGALAGASDPSEFASGIRRRLWRELHGVPFELDHVRGEFLHLGTTRQLRDALTSANPTYAESLMRRNPLAVSHWRLPRTARVYQSVLGDDDGNATPGVLGRRCVVEHSLLDEGCRIGDGCVISEAFGANLRLGRDLVLFTVPLREPIDGSHAARVVCGINDDFKGRFVDGRCHFLNRPIGHWFRRHGIRPAEVWRRVPPPERTLWNAKLFEVANAPVSRVAQMFGHRAADRRTVAQWRRAPRLSMADIVASFDPPFAGLRREFVAASVHAERAIGQILRCDDDTAVEKLFGPYHFADSYLHAMEAMAAPAGRKPETPAHALAQARGLWTAWRLRRRADLPQPMARRYAEQAFERVALASEIGYSGRDRRTRHARVRLSPHVRIEATSPARLDLAGGWSDTPPYCYERGGHVINVAIDLDGRPPVAATVTTLREPVLILESRDQRRCVELNDWNPAAPVDVKDSFCLHRVALRTAGLLPERPMDLTRHWERLGAGLHVTTEARVPKGSGLGTSSILAATLLAALDAACGRKPPQSALVERTLLLEQRLGTGGGWQDQVGGVAPAVKSSVSRPGVPQRPAVEVLPLSDHRLRAFEQRLVVYFSGQQRLARDILRQVMGRWLAREPEVVELMNALKRSAAALRAALLRGRWSDAARHVNEYWGQKKALYAGSTTEEIDSLFAATRSHYLAAALAGAGGGGFAYFLCADPARAQRLRNRLAERSARGDADGKVYETRINRIGLRVIRSRLGPES